MTIEMFMKQMNTEHKNGVVEKHIRRIYVPFAEKIAYAKKIIENSCYKEIEDIDGVKRKTFWVDSVLKHFFTVRSLIELYTDITFSDNATEEYDELCEKGYDQIILSSINLKDAEVFTNIVDMVYDDEYENINSIQGRLKNGIFGLDNILNNMLGNIGVDNANGGIDNDEGQGNRDDKESP